MKIFVAGIIAILIGILVTIISDFPAIGDGDSPANQGIAVYFLENTQEQTHVPNYVTAILADYRGFDTMIETGVVLIAGLAIMALLRRYRKKEPLLARKDEGDLILKVACRFMVPFMQLFALYVVAHGHHSPGGGFQGGVILGASLILIALSYDLKKAVSHLPVRKTIILGFAGLFIYAGIGVICMFSGLRFLDYGGLVPYLPATDEVMAHSHGMLGVEIGVAFTVMAIMFSIYKDLASQGRISEGL